MNKRFLIAIICRFWAFSILNFFPALINAQEEPTIGKEGDVEIISNPKHPIPEDGLRKRLVFEEDLSIGIAEGKEDYMFGEAICFNTDDEGNFYVSDMENLRIQKYNSQGEYLLTIGRKGQGPGEFQSLSIPRFDKDSNLYICDVTSRRISFFNKEGEFLKQIDMPGLYENLHMNSKGLMVANKEEQIPSQNALTIFSTFELLNEKFSTLAELQKIKREIALPGKDLSSRFQIMANMINLMVFKPQDFLSLARNDFIYAGHPDEYEINIFSPEGKPVKRIIRDYEPVPVSQKDMQDFEEELSQEETFRNAPEDYRKKIFQLIKYPKYKPAYQSYTLIGSGLNQSFALMENGWLALIVDYVKGEYTTFDLFDQEGRYIANFEAAIPAEGLFFNNRKAYAISTEEGYKFVKRYRIKLQELKGNNWVDSPLK
jgi:hypothetical protein